MTKEDVIQIMYRMSQRGEYTLIHSYDGDITAVPVAELVGFGMDDLTEDSFELQGVSLMTEERMKLNSGKYAELPLYSEKLRKIQEQGELYCARFAFSVNKYYDVLFWQVPEEDTVEYIRTECLNFVEKNKWMAAVANEKERDRKAAQNSLRGYMLTLSENGKENCIENGLTLSEAREKIFLLLRADYFGKDDHPCFGSWAEAECLGYPVREDRNGLRQFTSYTEVLISIREQRSGAAE